MGPTAASLRELPEIDFSAYRVRRNPYAQRIAREGIQIAHDGPSPESLAELPEADLERASSRRNPYASRAAEVAAKLPYGRGRPRQGDELGPTPARSLRLPEAAWKALEVEARHRHTTVHGLLREVIAAFLEHGLSGSRKG